MGKINPDPAVLTRHARHMLTTRWGEQNRARGVYLAQQIRAVERSAGHLTAAERARLHTALGTVASPPAGPPDAPPPTLAGPALAHWGTQTRQRTRSLPTHLRAVERSAHLLTPAERARLHAALDTTAPTPAPQPEKKNTP